MLYTRKGDSGTSGLFGTKARRAKDSAIYEALGTVDEANAAIGIARAYALALRGTGDRVATALLEAQQDLFVVQAELAGANKAVDQKRIDALEETIDRFEADIENPHAFVIPGNTVLSAFLDRARAVARRAERRVVALEGNDAAKAPLRAYLNRLSSLLYAMARSAGAEGGAETSPAY